MNTIESQLLEHGSKRQHKELHNLINNIDSQKLEEFVENKICSYNFNQLWDYILKSFSDSTECHKKRFRIVKKILNKIQKNEIPNNTCNNIIKRLLLDISSFKSIHLTKIVDWCLESIQSENITSNCWRDLLPDVLNVIATRDKIEYNDNEISGLDYKNEIVNSLCSIKWHFGHVATLASMFKDITLSKEHHLPVVSKLCKYIDGLTPQEIPPVVYQLLCLCKNQNIKQVFFYLQRYFSIRLYNTMYSNPESAETEFDLEAISSAPEIETIQAESTIIYHIYQIASVGNSSLKDYFNVLKIISKCPSYIINPFKITILLSISCIPYFEKPILELLKYSISRSISEEQRRKDSVWFKEMSKKDLDVKLVLEKILDNCIKERDLVVHGLINLAFSLLATGMLLGREQFAKKQWYFGQLIIVKLVKRQKDTAPMVLNMLNDKIITEQYVSQYTECIHQLCLTVPLVMLDNQPILLQMIEQLSQIPKSVGTSLVLSLIPLLKISYSIRDSLILVLRKSLFSREPNIRQMAVSGFLALIKYMKINDLVALSQSSETLSSSQSLLTQISADCHAQQPGTSTYSNDVLCLEIINVLRRCFSLQSEVRAQLYSGLYDAVCANPELKTHILDILLIHFKKFYNEDNEVLPPLQFLNIVMIKDANCILQEPIGKLVLTIGMVVTQSNENLVIPIKSLTLFNEIFQSVIDRLTKCELLHFELDNGVDFMDIMPESQKKQIHLMQILSVYEAVIGYLLFSWKKESENYGHKLSNIFKAYNRFSEFAKNLGKLKKVTGGNKKKNDDTFKKPASVKMQFKFPPTVLNLKIIFKAMQLLYLDSVEWTTKIQANMLKTKREFHHYILQTSLDIIQEIKTMKTSEINNISHIYSNCVNILNIIYQNAVVRINDLIDFDLNSAVFSLELFYKLITVVFGHFKNKLDAIFHKIVPSSASDLLPDRILTMVKVLEGLLERDEESDDEQKTNKIFLSVINIISILSSELLASHVEQILDWCNKFIQEHDNIDKSLAVPFINLIFSLQIRCKSSIQVRRANTQSVFENVATCICKIMGTADNEEVPHSEAIKIINEATVFPVLQSLCNHLKSQLDDIDWVIMNLRAEFAMINYPETMTIERKRELLKEKELDLCCYFIRIIEVAVIISNIAVPTGFNSEIILKFLAHLYNTLSSLTKYFIMRSSKDNLVFQHAKFENLIKLSGKQLSTNVYNLILFIEEGRQQSGDTQTQKKKSTVDSLVKKSKVLRETRFIPKLIFEMEQFGKFIIQLSSKTKEDLTKFVKQGTSRDFRIKAPALKSALENLTNLDENVESEMTEIGESVDITDDNSDVDTNSKDLSENESDKSDTDSDVGEPPSKKLKQ